MKTITAHWANQMKNPKEHKAKKVLLVITKSNFGGAQKYVYELAKNLLSRGFEVRVALGGDGILIDKLHAANIPVTVIPSLGRDVSILDDLKVFGFLYSLIKKERPDVVHLNSSKIGAIGATASRLALAPRIIFTIHGWAFNEDRSLLSKSLIKAIYLLTILLADKSIAVSNMTKEQARELPLHSLFANRIEVVHNGIDMPLFKSRDEARAFLSEKTGTSLEGKTIIGQIAELHPIKSYDTTIEAAHILVQKYPDLVFVLIGDGQEKERLTDKIRLLDLQDKVLMTGFVDNAAQYLKAFDVFCLTSKSEALALTLIETGMARVPAVASRVGGIPELIEDEKTGFLFEQGNVSNLQFRIEQALSLSEEQKRILTDTFHEKITRDFSIDVMTEKTIATYNL